jgi:hypothetical protein
MADAGLTTYQDGSRRENLKSSKMPKFDKESYWKMKRQQQQAKGQKKKK